VYAGLSRGFVSAAADSEAVVDDTVAAAVNRVMAYEDATSGSTAPAPQCMYLTIVLTMAVTFLIHRI
jgi:hypothetical protein